ncbi:hypothetical protein OCF10_16145 [Bacillus cereus]|uniref:Uncharacterized protein n=1 Tax=Bacillus cereus (strain AH820) TaxID=405535 RepID=B7JIH8_BACC0|nr:hypothetical protein [Bacillus cereus]ACK91646.1 protein of unknown function [Bacillus cereus AH820]KMP32620.1 hypothetical protein TU52_15440 [Bacillus cereus]MCU4990452.1 hypothetical protein [Bacillus cereus]MDV6367308.1 hypothetical protein [Bacillus cereus]QBZ28459.1 hypothetical protein FORC085_5410 [Bacillus cereus]
MKLNVIDIQQIEGDKKVKRFLEKSGEDLKGLSKLNLNPYAITKNTFKCLREMNKQQRNHLLYELKCVVEYMNLTEGEL